MKLGYLGPVGSYSNILTEKYFAHSTYTLHPHSQIQQLFENLDSDAIELAIVPIRNSTFGEVRESAEERAIRPKLRKLREYSLKVEHCLVGRQGSKVEDVQLVSSHEQALGQCREYLAGRGIAKHLKASSTANATHSLSTQNSIEGVDVGKCASICSESCAGLFDNLAILDKGIQDNKDNTTTFYLMSYRDIDGHSQSPITTQQNNLFGL